MIDRELYMQQIIPFIDQPFVKVIAGIRRCSIKITGKGFVENFVYK